MTNPHEQLRKYLEKLTYNFIYTNSILEQVNIFNDWYKKNGPQSIEVGSWFYKVSLYSFKRILTIEACKFLLEREDRSLVDWLDKAFEHAAGLKPSQYCPRQGYDNDLRILEADEYRELISVHQKNISEHKKITENLKSLRDKGFAHSDRKYFENPETLETEFPITWGEFNLIFDLIGKILKKHYSLLFNSDMSMKLQTLTSIDNILTHTRAFQRVWDNQQFIEMRIKLFAFKSDEYDPEDIFLK